MALLPVVSVTGVHIFSLLFVLCHLEIFLLLSYNPNALDICRNVTQRANLTGLGCNSCLFAAAVSCFCPIFVWVNQRGECLDEVPSQRIEVWAPPGPAVEEVNFLLPNYTSPSMVYLGHRLIYVVWKWINTRSSCSTWLFSSRSLA